jgi:hypothetical protein
MKNPDLCNYPKDWEWMDALFHGTPEYLIPLVRRYLEHEGYTIPTESEDLMKMSHKMMGGQNVGRKFGGFTLKEREDGLHHGRCGQCRKLREKPF